MQPQRASAGSSSAAAAASHNATRRATSGSGVAGADDRVQRCLERYNQLLTQQKSAAADLQTLLKGDGSKVRPAVEEML